MHLITDYYNTLGKPKTSQVWRLFKEYICYQRFQIGIVLLIWVCSHSHSHTHTHTHTHPHRQMTTTAYIIRSFSSELTVWIPPSLPLVVLVGILGPPVWASVHPGGYAEGEEEDWTLGVCGSPPVVGLEQHCDAYCALN